MDADGALPDRPTVQTVGGLGRDMPLSHAPLLSSLPRSLISLMAAALKREGESEFEKGGREEKAVARQVKRGPTADSSATFEQWRNERCAEDGSSSLCLGCSSIVEAAFRGESALGERERERERPFSRCCNSVDERARAREPKKSECPT